MRIRLESSSMCICTKVSRVCPKCATSFENIRQHCPAARANGKLCANCHIAEIPGNLCIKCKKSGGGQDTGIGYLVSHAARASVSSFKNHLQPSVRARPSEGQTHAADELTTVQYEHTRPADPIIRDIPPQERAVKAKTNRQTQWPAVLAARVVPSEQQESRALDHTLERPAAEGGGHVSKAYARQGRGPGQSSPLPPVLPDLELPSRSTSPLNSPSGFSDSSSVYSQD